MVSKTHHRKRKDKRSNRKGVAYILTVAEKKAKADNRPSSNGDLDTSEYEDQDIVSCDLTQDKRESKHQQTEATSQQILETEPEPVRGSPYKKSRFRMKPEKKVVEAVGMEHAGATDDKSLSEAGD